MKSQERSTRSASIVVIRSRVSGPVSVMVCLPIRPGIVPRVLGLLGFLFGVQVVQVAVELVEAVHGREELVAVA
jgi:hypothetical protein